ncbi:MAG: GNAT family N-acetyltransferase [Silicimonas sp.]|nr:GNAT family N-acetyltransferase [Silicimonas sp.]
MIVRPATAADASAIADIQNPIIRDTAITFNSRERSPAEVAEAIQNQPCFLVAEEAGDVIGFAHYFQFRGGLGYARTMEHTIVLSPHARGLGVGRALMNGIETDARTSGVGSLWAGVSGENPDGVTFHKRVGFEEVARLPKVGFKFGRWMDLILLRKWLQRDDETSRHG